MREQCNAELTCRQATVQSRSRSEPEPGSKLGRMDSLLDWPKTSLASFLFVGCYVLSHTRAKVPEQMLQLAMIKQTMQFLVPLLSRISLGGGSGGPCRWKLQVRKGKAEYQARRLRGLIVKQNKGRKGNRVAIPQRRKLELSKILLVRQIQNPRDYMKKKNRTNERTPKQDAQGLRSYPKSQIPLFLGE